MSTEPGQRHDAASDADTMLAEGLRPRLDGPGQEQQRRAIEAALFGGEAEATTFGRYRLLQRLGRGGMGSVYAAYDDHLERKIAIKLIHTSTLGSAETRERTLREARALARLSHPNVVHVYEVGEIEGQLFVAMEFVAGPTLRAWLDGAARGWREVLAALQQAGAGLAAAHAEGIVHRDFKPHNVMLGADGRVRVLDFGLARFGDTEDSLSDECTTTLKSSVATLTRTGALLGTPAYMSPEQWTRGKADARSDQFTFCVVAYEALYGHRPFVGDSPGELMEAIADGRVAPRPRDTRVPQWVHAVVLRGLQIEPGRRWPSMPALLAALGRDPGARMRRIAAVAGLLLGAGAIAGVAGYRRWDVAERAAACEAKGAGIDPVWNDDARQRLRDAFAATGVSYAATTVEKVIPWLDRAVTAWKEQRTEVCLNAEVRGVWDEDLVARAEWCLEEEQAKLTSMIDGFQHANATTVQRAVASAARIQTTGRCDDEGHLRLQPPAPAQGRDAFREVNLARSRADALSQATRYDEALAAITSAQAMLATDALDWAPLRATVLHEQGRLLSRMGRHTDAERAHTDAYFEGAPAGAWDVAAFAAIELVRGVGYNQGRLEEGHKWARHAEMAIAQAGDQAALKRAQLLRSVASLHYVAGRNQEARLAMEEDLALTESVLGSEHPDVSIPLGNLGTLLVKMESYAPARALLERALAVDERTHGPEHPDVAITLANLALVYGRTGAHAEAQALLRRSLVIKERAFGPEHPSVLKGLQYLSISLAATGPHDEAQAMGERAVALAEKTYGPDHSEVADALVALGSVLFAAGRYAEVRPLAERSLAITEKLPNPDPVLHAERLNNLAAIDLREDRPEDALPLAERAWAILEAVPGVQEREFDVRASLASALWATGGDRARALAEARIARDFYRDAGARKATQLADVERWLAEHESEPVTRRRGARPGHP